MIHLREELLDRAACESLLRERSVGRISINVPGWPPVLRPISYFFDDDTHSIVFRSGHGSKLTALLVSSQAAFEIDDVDDSSGIAWSVIGLGIIEIVDRFADLARFERRGTDLWSPGDKAYWFSLRPENLTGRRLTRSVEPAESKGFT